MLLNLNELKQKHNLTINGVLHIGAHHGEEFDTYKSMGIKKIIFVEPHPTNFKVLVENVQQKITDGDEVMFIFNALGDERKITTMYCETKNTGQSNSLLEPAQCLQEYPDIVYETKINVTVERLDDLLLPDWAKDINFINIDTEGYELMALRGGVKFIKHVQYIYSEISSVDRYKGCTKIDELEMFLAKNGFTRADIKWVPSATWGDAFYLRTHAAIEDIVIPMPNPLSPSAEIADNVNDGRNNTPLPHLGSVPEMEPIPVADNENSLSVVMPLDENDDTPAETFEQKAQALEENPAGIPVDYIVPDEELSPLAQQNETNKFERPNSIAWLKQIRYELDTHINTAMFNIISSREVSLCITHLENTKMMLGMCLKHIGDTTPYVNSSNIENDTIEPTAEHADDNSFASYFEQYQLNTQTLRVKAMRSLMDEIIDMLSHAFVDLQQAETLPGINWYELHLHESIMQLSLAKMRLGTELQRIKGIKDGVKNFRTPVSRDLPL